jgi:hypothetical protein
MGWGQNEWVARFDNLIVTISCEESVKMVILLRAMLGW